MIEYYAIFNIIKIFNAIIIISILLTFVDVYANSSDQLNS